jgi:hypothetical protein
LACGAGEVVVAELHDNRDVTANLQVAAEAKKMFARCSTRLFGLTFKARQAEN